jgi:hypothetical protein
MYGVQNVYLCEYVSGEPQLHPDSTEAKISRMGKNTYEPMWLPLGELEGAAFRTERLKRAILDGVKNGWPAEPVDITDMYR